MRNRIIPIFNVIITCVLVVGWSGCGKIVEQIPLPKPEADFELLGETYIAPCEIEVYNKSYFATVFSWDAGTGHIYSDRDPVIYIGDAGTYTLRLTVTNEDGQSDTVEKTIEVASNSEVPNQSPWAGKWLVTSGDISQRLNELPYPTFLSFEFVESRYLIYFNESESQYGELIPTDQTLYLSKFGQVQIMDVTASTMKLEIDGYTYELAKQATALTITDTILRLTNDGWVTKATNALVAKNDEWLFTQNGTFVQADSTSHRVYSWSYTDESNIVIDQGSLIPLSIEELTNTRLLVKDQSGNEFVLNTLVKNY